LAVFRKKNISIPLLTCILISIFWLGCSSHRAADGSSPNPRSIEDILINEDSDSLILSIKGNQMLTCTAENQSNPNRVILYFPATTLKNVRGHFIPPENEVISAIRTVEFAEKNVISSRILISLRKEVAYDLIPNETGLRVVFPKNAAQLNSIKPPKESENPGPARHSTHQTPPTAGRLLKVTAKSLDAMLSVTVEADGAILDYKSFTIGDPGRIVFDLYHIKSPYDGEHKISVQSRWVRQIRYFGHPDKLRLVFDTHSGRLPQYSSLPTHTGLLIQVGQIPANAE